MAWQEAGFQTSQQGFFRSRLGHEKKHSMTRIPVAAGLLCWTIVLCSCKGPQHAGGNETSDPDKGSAAGRAVPSHRTQILDSPVAQYRVRTANTLNDWYFTVRMYETANTFAYKIEMQFENVQGADTIWLPDLGIAPKPIIRPDQDKYSCTIGFEDAAGNFKPYKRVLVIGGKDLKLVSLRHYALLPADPAKR